MRLNLILSALILFSISCKKDDDKTEPTSVENTPEEVGFTAETYQNLNTTLIFEDEFNDLISWQVDTSTVILDYPLASEGYGDRCHIEAGSVFLKAYHEVTYDSATNKYEHRLQKAKISREIGTLPFSKQYLVEMDIGILRSYRRYYTKTGNHNSTGGKRGTQVFLTLNGVQYEVFGKHITEEMDTPQGSNSIKSDCITSFEETTLKLIIDSVDLNNVALDKGQVAKLCTIGKDTASAPNEIRINVNPRTDGSFGIGAPNINSSKPDSCIIKAFRLYAIK